MSPARHVWEDVRRKIYYCSEEKPKKLQEHYVRSTEA